MSKGAAPEQDPVQQVINEATDLLQRLTLERIVGDRVEMVAAVKEFGEYANSSLEVMDLALQNLWIRDRTKYREIANRLIAEDHPDLKDTGVRMLFKFVQTDGDAEAVDAISAVLTSDCFQRDDVLALIEDNADEIQRGFVFIAMAVMAHYVPRDMPHN